MEKNYAHYSNDNVVFGYNGARVVSRNVKHDYGFSSILVSLPIAAGIIVFIASHSAELVNIGNMIKGIF